jgi:hypothetical protein
MDQALPESNASGLLQWCEGSKVARRLGEWQSILMTDTESIESECFV